MRTYKTRRGRVTGRQQRGLLQGADLLLDPGSPITPQWVTPLPLVIEIGFGTGEATVAMATANPELAVLAVDVHTPGIGDLLALLVDERVENVRVIEGDALDVLENGITERRLHGVRSFFPDPWPKARHHKRRLVQRDVVELVASRTAPGGWWHLATDWAEYAESMLEVFDASPLWDGGVIQRPQSRPITRYERRGLTAGRTITDLLFTRTD